MLNILNEEPKVVDIEGNNCENPDKIIQEFSLWKELGPVNLNHLIETCNQSQQIKKIIKRIDGGIKYYNG